jgi:uncharacterized protein (UPF0276 family)
LLEILSDNLLFVEGGPLLLRTRALAERTGVVLHGVGLDIGGPAPLCREYLEALKRLVRAFNPRVVSDHLAFTRAGGRSSYELLPIPKTMRYLRHVAKRVEQVQEVIGHRLCLENPSAYITFRDEEMTEGDFLSELAVRTGCGVLLDVNNLYVNAFNFGRCATDELRRFPEAAVMQIHVAGHADRGSYLFDTHDQGVVAPVCELLELALGHITAERVPVVLERDDRHSAAAVALAELDALSVALSHPDGSEAPC